METLDIILSKAQSIRFAIRDGLMPSMQNQLSYEEVWNEFPGVEFKHTFFVNDAVLIQIKCGLTATVVLTKYDEAGHGSVVSQTAQTAHTGFIIRDYVVALGGTEGLYKFIAASESSSWESEYVDVINEDADYKLLQWTNLDTESLSFEFDYNTASAIAYVNFMRILAQDSTYTPAGETEVFDNQNEKAILKSTTYTKLLFETDMIPRAIAQQIIFAMSHDLFLMNEVVYVVEKKASVKSNGAWHILTAEMTENLSLGINTHDIGFNCDGMADTLVKNIELLASSGDVTGSGTAGYSVNQIILHLKSGATGNVRIGTTYAGDDILKYYQLSTASPFIVLNRNFLTSVGLDNSWSIYANVVGAVGVSVDIYIQTIKTTV
jgi:hypothetical protein